MTRCLEIYFQTFVLASKLLIINKLYKYNEKKLIIVNCIINLNNYTMKNIKDITISIFSIIGLMIIISSFDKQPENSDPDVVILKLMGKKLESAYEINNGTENKVRKGLTGYEALEGYLYDGYEIKGTSVASDAGRYSVVYTLVK